MTPTRRRTRCASASATRATCAALAALGLAGSLSGCFPLAVGGVVGGAFMSSDRRTSGTQIDDEAIELKAASRLRSLLDGRSSVSVTSYNRLVLLTGEVPGEAEKTAVEQTVSRVEDVRSIVNELVVADARSLFSRSGDSLITSKVKAGLIDSPDLLSNAFKVVTERGVVYLMGRVTEREAGRAAEVARDVGGVRKVVRVFDIVSDAELVGGGAAAKP